MSNKMIVLPTPSYFAATPLSPALLPAIANHRAHAQRQYALLSSAQQNYRATGKDSRKNNGILWELLEHSAYEPVVCHALKSGAFVSDLSYFITKHPALAEQYILNTMPEYTQKEIISALVDAYWQRTLVVYVPAHIVLELPIALEQTLLHAGQLMIEKIIIILGKNSVATIDDRWLSTATNYVHIRAIDCFIGVGAQLTFVQEHDHAATGNEFSQIRMYCEQKSEVQVALFSTGSAVHRQLLNIFLKGKKSVARVTGTTVLNNNKEYNLTVRQDHYAPNTTSTVRIKQLVTDAARSVYNGTIFVALGADGTHAAQHTQALVLSDKAHAWAQPELEVLTNEVQCAHGSAVGQLDEMHLFYLQARGLSRVQAQRLLIESFIADTLNIAAFCARKEYLLYKTIDAVFPKRGS